MKYSLTLISILAMLGAIRSQAGDVLPPRFNFDRYSKMVDQSPFAIATAAALPAATPDFAKDLYVANAAHSPEGDLVTIASTSEQNFKKYLTTKEPVDGYSIANIEWSDRVGATKVTISKDGNFATLTFNEALLSQRAAEYAVPNAAVSQSAGFGGDATLPKGRCQPGRPSPPCPAPSLSSPGVRGITRPHARGMIPQDPRGRTVIALRSQSLTDRPE